MITLREVQQSIDELEELPHNWDTAQKLAVMLVLQDYLTPRPELEEMVVSRDAEPEPPPIPADSGFLQLAIGGDPVRVWAVLDELMSTLEAMQPRIYAGVMRRLRGEE